MAEETKGQEPTGEDAPPRLIPAPNTDRFLQAMVDMANAGNNELGVTLFVGGAIITGTLTSYQSYFAHLGDQVEKATYHVTNVPADATPVTPEIRAMMGDVFRKIGDQ